MEQVKYDVLHNRGSTVGVRTKEDNVVLDEGNSKRVEPGADFIS